MKACRQSAYVKLGKLVPLRAGYRVNQQDDDGKGYQHVGGDDPRIQMVGHHSCA